MLILENHRDWGPYLDPEAAISTFNSDCTVDAIGPELIRVAGPVAHQHSEEEHCPLGSGGNQASSTPA